MATDDTSLGSVSLDTKPAEAALDKLEQKLDALEKKQREGGAKGRELAVGAVGGEEIVDRYKKVTEGFKLAGDAQQTFTTRLMAGGASAIRVAAVVYQLGEAFVQAAIKAEQHSNQLAALGGRYEEMRAAANGALSVEEAFAQRQALLATNFVVRERDQAALSAQMREYAAVMGGTAQEAQQRFFQALQAGDNTALAPFRVHVNEADTANNRFRDGMRQLEEQTRRNVPLQRSINEETEAAGRTWSQATDEVIDYITSFGRMDQAERNRQIRERAADVERRRNTEAQRRASEEARQASETLRASVGRMQQQNLEATSATNVLKNALEDLRDAARHAGSVVNNFMGSASEAAMNRIRELRRESAATRVLIRNLRQEGASAQEISAASVTDPLARQGGGGGGNSRLRELQRQLEGERNMLSAIGGNGVDEAAAGAGLRGERRLRALIATYREASEQHQQFVQDGLIEDEAAFGRAAVFQARYEETVRSNTDAIEQQARTVSDSLNATERELRTVMARFDFGQQLASQFGLAADEMGRFNRRTTTLAEEMSTSVRGAFDTMTSAFRSHLAAVITGKEDLGTALKGIVHETLLNLATESAVKAIFNAAQGFALLASYQYPQAAAAFTSAGLYAGVAVAAGAGAAVTVPTPSAGASAGAGSSSGSAPRLGAGAGGSAVGGTSTVYNITYAPTVGTTEGAQDLVRQLQNGSHRRGLETVNEAAARRSMSRL